MPVDCERVTERAEELALDLVDEPERSELLRHVDSCPRCRALLDELSATADQLTLVAAEAEPPPGFEARAVAVMSPDSPLARVPRRPRRRRVLLAAAAAALVVVAAVGGVLVGRSSSPKDQRASELDRVGVERLAAAPLRTADGARVGDAMLLDSSPPSLWMSLDDAKAGERYRCEVVLADGTHVVVGEWSPRGTSHTWSIELDPASAGATQLRVSDEGGKNVAVAHLR